MRINQAPLYRIKPYITPYSTPYSTPYPQPPVAGNKHLRPESGRDSMASSNSTEKHYDSSSALSSKSSKSSKSTSFTGDASFGKSATQAGPQRQTYNVRPKGSIPSDMAPSDYARQCIAAAESSRLNPYSLHPEEHSLLRKHITPQQVTSYLNIRNGILRLWTRNPMIGVMREEAIGCARDTRWFDLASVCYDWLVRRGYINYGCLEHMKPAIASIKKGRTAKRKQKTVAVIGAGMSGLGCARQLEGLFSQYESHFHDIGEEVPRIVVLEGRDRIGGRVYSRPFKSKPSSTHLKAGSRHTAEMGGMIITGFDRGNPLNIIVRGQLALPYHKLNSKTTIYDATGQPVDIEKDLNAEKLFNYILERVAEYRFKIPLPKAVDGDKDLLDAGRDVTGEGTQTLFDIESFPQSSTSEPSQTTQIQMVATSANKLTGKTHLEPGIPAVHTAAFKAREIGWALRPGVGIEHDLDLENAVARVSATVGSVFDEALRQYSRMIDFTPLDLRLINWHIANLEYSNAITYNNLSLGGWDLDSGNEWDGHHTMVLGGYQQVPRGLFNFPTPLNVQKKSHVKKIIYNANGMTSMRSRLECADGEVVEADYVISTIPLGVLKLNKVEFQPPLPDWKQGAIKRIGFGVLNKVVLVYKEAFWDASRDIFGTLRNPANSLSLDQADYVSQRGRFFQWFNCSDTSGLPTLLALMAGDAAFHTERIGDTELVDEATKVLRGIFGHHVPPPVEAVVTRWKKDEFAHGSYSYTGPHFQPNDYEEMAKPIGSLFFAGEHTCGTHPATVHGAYISGLRVASEVLETMIGPIPIPDPLVMSKDNPSKRKLGSESATTDPKQARLDAYEVQVWNAIYAHLGDRPWLPAKNYANPYRLFSKDRWEEAKKSCDQGRRLGKGRAEKNEVKKAVTAMWHATPEHERKHWNDAAALQKEAHATALAEYTEKAAKWDKDALIFRAQWEKENPSVPGPDEIPDSPSRRDRRARRLANGYAEVDEEFDLDLGI